METIDGSATAGEDYVPVKQTLVFKPEQTYIEYVVEIIDDNVYEPDETFFVKMALEPDQDAIMGKKSINMITIINDDGEPPCRCSKSFSHFLIACNLNINCSMYSHNTKNTCFDK